MKSSKDAMVSVQQLVQDFFEKHLTIERNASDNTVLAYRDAFKLFLHHAAQRNTGARVQEMALCAVATADARTLVEELSDFMEYFNGNLAREAGRPLDWHGSFWADRFHLVPISPEPEALVERMRYVLSNTIKENLVARVADWEGLHCAEALIDGKPRSLAQAQVR